MPNQIIEEHVMQASPTMLGLEKAINSMILKLETSQDESTIKIQISVIDRALENYTKEIDKITQNLDLDRVATTAVTLLHSAHFLSSIFMSLTTLQLSDPDLVKKGVFFIDTFQDIRAKYKPLLKIATTSNATYKELHCVCLTFATIIRDYLVMTNKDINDYEYLENILLSIISLNKIIQIKKDQPLQGKIPYYLELILKKIDLVQFYFNKGHHHKIAIDYLEKTIPLFEKLNNKKLTERENSEFERYKNSVTKMLDTFIRSNLNYHPQYTAFLITRMIQITRRCLGTSDHGIVAFDQALYDKNKKNVAEFKTAFFTFQSDDKTKSIRICFPHHLFQSRMFNDHQGTINWSYKNKILTIKNPYEISFNLFKHVLQEIHDQIEHAVKQVEDNETIKKRALLTVTPSTQNQEESATTNNNNHQFYNNTQKPPKTKTKGVPGIKEKEEEKQPSRSINTYTARELGFFVPKQYENYVVRELTGADLPNGIFYGFYDFHPTAKDLETLGMSNEQLTLYQSKFDEAHLVTDSKTGIVITKDKDFYVNVYAPATTEDNEPKIVQKVHIHTGLKVSIAAMDHRIEAEPISATKTKEHTPILWRFFKPTTHKKNNFKLSTTEASCNNNNQTKEVPTLNNNNSPK